VTPLEAEAEAEVEAEAWGRARQSPLLRPRPDSGGRGLLLSVFPWWLAQLPERGEQRCFPVRTVSEGAK
jgi:hypothetical protein